MVVRQNDPKLKALARDEPILARKIAASQHDVHAYLNKRIGQVKIGSKVRFVDMQDAALHFYSKPDMATILGHLTVLDSKGETVPAFRWWLATEDRRQFDQVTFEPDLKKAPAGALNMWRGFGVMPKAKPGGWAILNDHIRRNLCRNDDEAFEYSLDWMAHQFQRPGVKIGVALILFGDKGCGKSVVSDVLGECVGLAYAPCVDTPEGLTGKHNSHLSKAVLIRVEEAINPRDPRHESRLKHLITGGRILIEPKGVDAFEIDSKCNVIFTTNKAHCVPATAAERRFFALHCGNDNRQDGAFFKGLLAQMRDGGYGAFVHDLMVRDISKTDFSKPPVTALLSTQIASSMTGLERWWCAALATGALPFVKTPDDVAEADLEWPETGCWELPKAVVQESATAFARDYAGPPTPEAVGKFLAANVPGIEAGRRQAQHDRQRVYIMPPLDECRVAFVAARPGLLLEHVTDAIPTTKKTVTATVTAPIALDAGGRNVLSFRAANAA